MTITDSEAIHGLITAWADAITARDIDGITGRYTAETVLFDAIPPYKTIGREAIRQAWINCLPYFPDRFTTELRDVAVQVSGDVAWSHFLLHFTAIGAEHPCGQTWMRATVGWRRRAGVWMVDHEHMSVPFNPMTSQVWFIKDPAVADMPDFGCAGDGANAPGR